MQSDSKAAQQRLNRKGPTEDVENMKEKLLTMEKEEHDAFIQILIDFCNKFSS